MMGVRPIKTAEERAAEVEALIANVAEFIRDRDVPVRAVHLMVEDDHSRLQTYREGGLDTGSALYEVVAVVAEQSVRAMRDQGAL